MLPNEKSDGDPTFSREEQTTELGAAVAMPSSVIIGRYHLLQKIGEGGMGEVWLAEQKEPVRRRVALKLIKAGMNTREVIARFESERQALALMEHPAIARVFDAGSTPEGAPYFAMEYVAGVPITEYCDNHRLPIQERLELFTQVCEGVRHAHQKAVIHRDLKPSNILVTEVDGKPAVKIIDFGVAKALSQKLTEHTMFTRVGVLIGTPEYMSPEQALSSGEDIDIRTDVYSLGIIFYELLAGAPPIELRRLAFDEFLQRLREEDPQRPSTKIRTRDAATSTELARKRQTEPRALAKLIGGDLDAIALKALEKDRARRYGSVSDFAADIERYLNHEAVLAVAPSVPYRAQKFARRHRAALVTACAFAAVLVAASVVSLRQSLRANREAAVAEAVSNFLRNDVLAQASAATQAGPKTKPDPDLKVRTALDRAAIRIGGKFEKQPEVEAAVRETIGETYEDLGLYPEARTQLERALELERGALGTTNPATLRTLNQLGSMATRQGKYKEAEAFFSEVLEAERSRRGPEHPYTLSVMSNLAAAYEGQTKYAQAEAIESQVLEVQRRVMGVEHPDTLSSMNNLASLYNDEGKFGEAEVLYVQAFEIRERVLGPEHPQTLTAMDNLAWTYFQESKYAKAEELGSRGLEILKRVMGPEHPDTIRSMNHLAGAYMQESKFAQAESMQNQALKAQTHVLGAEHPETLASAVNLGSIFNAEGKYGEAMRLQSETLEVMRRVLGPVHPYTLGCMCGIADGYAGQQEYARAEIQYRQTLEIYRKTMGAEHPATLGCAGSFASMYQREDKYALAEELAAEVLTGRRHVLGSENEDTMGAAADLALVYISERKFTEAEPLAREAMDFYRKKGTEDWQRFSVESQMGASLAGQKKYSEAEPLLLAGYQGMLAKKDVMAIPDRYHLERAQEWLVQMYKAWGKPEKAAEWGKKRGR